jgi:hypothetical protein
MEVKSWVVPRGKKTNKGFMSEIEEDTLLTEEQRKKGQPRLVLLAVMGSVNNAFITSISALFLLALNATAFQVGLLASASHLERATRLIGLYLIPKIGKAPLMFWGRVLSILPTLTLIVLALYLRPGTQAVWLAIIMITLRGLLQQTANTSWWPLIQDNTAGDAIGHFLARMRMAQSALGIILPICVGWYLGTKPPAEHFTPLFALSLLATFLGAWWIRKVSERPQPDTNKNLFQRLWHVVNHSPVQRLGIYMAAYMCLRSMGYTFWVVLLTDRGMPYMHFVWLTSVSALGTLICLPFWGKIVDRHGGRSAISMALLGMFILGFAWITLPTSALYFTLWASIIFLSWGIIDGAHQMGRTHTMMKAVSPDYQAESFSTIMYGASFGGMVGGLLGGAIFEYVQSLPDIPYDPERLYLAGIQFLYFIVFLLSRTLPGHADQTTTRDLIRNAGQRAPG